MEVISISITSYNACNTIESAIESAVNQSWPNKEIIVYDDCSTDGTVELLKRLEKQIPEIKVHYGQMNKGVAYARNQLINYAKGEFIAFFDDDDLSLPSRIEKQYQAITKAELELKTDMIICHTARKQIYPNGYEKYEATMGCENEIKPTGANVADRILYGRISQGVIGSCATCSQMGRKSLYKGLKGFDVAFRRIDDTEFNVRLALAGVYFVGVSKPLVVQSMTMASHKTLINIMDENNLLWKKYSNYLRGRGWYEFNVKWQKVRENYFSDKKILFLSSIIGIFLCFPKKTITRIRWSLPALKVRNDFKKWHAGNYS